MSKFLILSVCLSVASQEWRAQAKVESLQKTPLEALGHLLVTLELAASFHTAGVTVASNRLGCRRAAVRLTDKLAPSLPSPSSTFAEFEYTHLEINSMIWRCDGVTLLVDPVAGQLDFGIPQFYRANQKVLNREASLALMVRHKPDAILLTQGLDDHTSPSTIQALLGSFPHLRVICAPSAAARLEGVVPVRQLTLLHPGQKTIVHTSSGSSVEVHATEGALVGPPWQARENAYLVSSRRGPSVYYEPHGDVDPQKLRRSGVRADVIITPVTEQRLPGLRLVHGPRRAVDLARALDAKVLVPLRNGELNTAGPLAEFISASGSIDEAQALLDADQDSTIRIVPTEPGKRVKIDV